MTDYDPSGIKVMKTWRMDDREFLHHFGDHFGVKWFHKRSDFAALKEEFKAMFRMSHWCEDKYWVVPDEKRLINDLVFFCKKHDIPALQSTIDRLVEEDVMAPSTDICPCCNGSGKRN